MTQQLNDMKIAILVDDLFEQAELAEPKKALEAAGATVHIVSPKGPQVTGMKHHDKGDSFDVDVPLDQAKPEDYDGLVLPGGVVNADTLRTNKAAQAFVKAIDGAGKPIAVVCHGPWLLISAGLAAGRTLDELALAAGRPAQRRRDLGRPRGRERRQLDVQPQARRPAGLQPRVHRGAATRAGAREMAMPIAD